MRVNKLLQNNSHSNSDFDQNINIYILYIRLKING